MGGNDDERSYVRGVLTLKYIVKVTKSIRIRVITDIMFVLIRIAPDDALKNILRRCIFDIWENEWDK